MSEATHTPGPWEVNYDNQNGIYAVTDKPLRVRNGKVTYRSIKICAHDECDYTRSPEERAATAKLIAAAPEMLEALQYVLSGISRIPDDVMDTITNAIRKATQ